MRKTALGQLRTIRTCESIISTVGYILKSLSLKEDISLDEHDYKSSEEVSLLQALRGQRTIGWKSMLQGLVHIGWANRQNKYMETNGTENKKNSIIQWK